MNYIYLYCIVSLEPIAVQLWFVYKVRQSFIYKQNNS